MFSFARSVLKQVATAYAFVFTGRHISERFAVLRAAMDGGEEAAAGLQALPEMHATSAGLKVHPSLVVSTIQRVNQIIFAVWHVSVAGAVHLRGGGGSGGVPQVLWRPRRVAGCVYLAPPPPSSLPMTVTLPQPCDTHPSFSTKCGLCRGSATMCIVFL